MANVARIAVQKTQANCNGSATTPRARFRIAVQKTQANCNKM